uniref:YncE family protein n=1 Tax=Pantoea sp. TaxID=69393 RepID=UPI003917C61E
DTGKVQVFNARPPFNIIKTLDTGPITNHVNIVENAKGSFAWVTVGGLNRVNVYRTDDFSQVASIPVGNLPHGLWPSGDGTRIYVGLENADALAAIDTTTYKVMATIPIGQAPQAVAYIPGAVPEGNGMQGLQPLGIAGQAVHLQLRTVDAARNAQPTTTVSLFEQGITQVLQASATGLKPKQSYLLALSSQADGSGELEPLTRFMTNPAGAAIVNAVGPIRQIVDARHADERRYLVIAQSDGNQPGNVVQVQVR